MKNLVLAAALCTGLVGSAAYAQVSQRQPSVQVTGGNTTLNLDPTLVEALAFNDVAITANSPATETIGVNDDITVQLPVVAGGVDTATLKGAVYHSGGITFTSTGNTSEADTIVTVSALALTNGIPTTPPELFGVLTLNGNVLGVYPLFNVAAQTKLPVGNEGTFTLSNVKITLSQEGAKLLNTAFGFDGFAEGQAIGNATIMVNTSDYTTIGEQRHPSVR